MKKVVLKLELFDEKVKQKAMKSVSSLSGVESISMDMKDKKLTVTGDIDPVTVVAKLRKHCNTDMVSVGPAKEPEKKKEEEKKKVDTKDDGGPPNGYPLPYSHYYHQPLPYQAYNYNYHHQQPTPYYTGVVQDDNPNACVIC